MNILPYIHKQYNIPCFQAKPLARYDYLNDKNKNVTVYQLEKRDIDYLQYISDNIVKFYRKYEIDDDSTKQVLKEAVDAGIEILKGQGNFIDDKARVMLALSDNQPSAILIGNTLKIDKKGEYHYSSRKNHSADETELDWLATWNKKIPGEGKVIVNEFFHNLLTLGFKQVYVRSEIPEKSFALEFYKKMGFHLLSNKQRKIFRKNDYKYMIGDYDCPKDNIIPMKATTKDIVRTVKYRSKELKRKDFLYNPSISLSTKNLI